MRPLALLLAVLPFTAASSPEDPAPNWGYLSTLLARCSPAVLHDILHQLSPKFQDGIFSLDTAAIEHVHSENHVMATKLVHMALKRQDNGTATTTSESPPDSSQESIISSALSEDIAATTLPDPTTVAVAPTTPAGATPVETVEGAIVFSTVGGGVVTETSRNVGVSFTRSSSTKLVTSTAANGNIETLTSVVVVNAPVTGSPDADAAGAAATTNPGLQDAAIAAKASAMLLVAAGLGAAAFVL